MCGRFGDAPFSSETLALSTTSANDYLYLDYGTVLVPGEEIASSAPIVLTGLVPEPTTGVLVGLGLSLCVGLARRGRSGSGASRAGG